MYTDLAPINLLLLEHEDGAWAIWFLNEDMEHLSGEHAGLAPDVSRSLVASYCSLFDGIWKSLVMSPRPPRLTERERHFFRIPISLRRLMLDYYLSQFDFATGHVSIPVSSNAAACGMLIDLGPRRLPLDTVHLLRIFDSSSLQEAYVGLLRTGRLTWPSPVDGRELQAMHAYCLGGNRFAYRLVDEKHAVTFYLVADEIHFRVVCVYIAQARLALAPGPSNSQADMSDLSRAMFYHVLDHGEALDAYLQSPAKEVVHAWRGVSAMHLGHVLWNDISGIGNLVASVPAPQLPRFLVFEADAGPEMYGPLDEIFPEIKGKVTRNTGTFEAAVSSFYLGSMLLIKATSHQVSRAVRGRIVDRLLCSPANAELVADCRAAAERGGPIIILGLRTENRMLTDLPGFCKRLVTFLAQRVGRATLVIDGHNARNGLPNQFFWSHGEHQASRSPIEVEQEILADLRRHAVNTDIDIIGTIGMSLDTSLAWSCHSAFFITMWGAGLAKYRWIGNKPGLVLTSRWNMENRIDLNIYHDPSFLEEPAPIEFIDKNVVYDRPDAPLLLRFGMGCDPSIMNFDLDDRAAFSTISKLLSRFADVADGRASESSSVATQLAYTS